MSRQFPPKGHALPLPATADEIVAWVQYLRATRDHITESFSQDEWAALGKYTAILVDEILRLHGENGNES